MYFFDKYLFYHSKANINLLNFILQNWIKVENKCMFQKIIYIYKQEKMDIKVVESQNEIYHKQKLLGEGAFGKAYLVRRKADNQLLVIKEMNIDHMSQQQRNQTIKEAQILRNLNHPNIVKFVEVYVTKQNKLKIVMEYAECGDLSKAISERKKTKKFFEQNQILDWFTQICLAMKHVHDRKILHRDIKGQNIFISKTNTLKLGDFGIARVLNKTMDKARTVVGTPYYLSPEIIENRPYSFQSDIWSIGVVLYELCALTHPFTATSLQFLALKIVKGSFTPIPNQYSKQLRNLVASMLSLDPNKRPSINEIFKNPLIQDRIKNFLTQTKRDHQFSHTILHNHKVQIFANRLVEMKQQIDFQKEKEKLKQQEALLKQKLQQKRSQERLKVQQEQQRQREIQNQREKYLQRERLKEIERQRQKQKQQQNRRQLLQKQRQRKQYERKQAIFEQQRRKEEQQRKIQRQYEQNCKMAKYIEQKIKDEEGVNKLRRQQNEVMYRQSQRQQQIVKADKMRKMQEKQLQEERKKKQLQEFARKQFFQNQQIMRRAKQRAKQSQQEYNSYSAQTRQTENIQQEKIPQFGNRNTAQNFHYQNKKNQQYQSASEVKNTPKNQNSHEVYKQTGSGNKNYQTNPDIEKKHSSIRDQIKKDRQNFMKNKNQQPNHEQQNHHSQMQALSPQSKTVKAAKWQRPKSRENENFQIQKNLEYQQQSKVNCQQHTINDQTYVFMDPKISPKDQQNFEQYIFELENIMQNLNQNIENIENYQKKSPTNNNTTDNEPKQNIPSEKDKKQVNFVLSDLPEVEEVIFRQDDQQTFELSLTAQFNHQGGKKSEILPQIEASTDLDLFSNFSKLQTLRMNLEDKFGTDNFVQLYRFLQNQMNQKGIQAFTNQQSIVNEASRKFNINKGLLMESFTLLLTLIHMEQRMMGCHY